jgi:2'-5' RNA ligase
VSATYAVVAYLEGELAVFVATMRARLTPHDHHLRPHVTILPPLLFDAAKEEIEAQTAGGLKDIEPFALEFGVLRSFAPVTHTLYLELASGTRAVLEAHNALLRIGMHGIPAYPFVPHLTLAKHADPESESASRAVLEAAWRDYSGSRDALVTACALVVESSPNHWNDLAVFPLFGR